MRIADDRRAPLVNRGLPLCSTVGAKLSAKTACLAVGPSRTADGPQRTAWSVDAPCASRRTGRVRPKNGLSNLERMVSREPGEKRPDHELALRLELARRERGLSTQALAEAVYLSPRTIRRYLSGARRPTRETVVLWEKACELQEGDLTRFYDGSQDARANGDGSREITEERDRAVELTRRIGDTSRPPREANVSPSRQSASRQNAWPSLGKPAVVVLVLAGLGVFLFFRFGVESKETTDASSVAHHSFPIPYVGDVWARITPAPEHVDEDHEVTLRWGPKMRRVILRQLGPRPQSLLFKKLGRDSVPLQVLVRPPARITFGEKRPLDSNARDINAGWTKSD